MRVRIDDQIFVRQRVGGISRYFTELGRRFTTEPSLGIELTQGPMWTANTHLLADGAGLGRSLPGALGKRRRVLSAANRLTHRYNGDDLVHHTYYDPSVLRRTAGSQRVVTVYDMIPELFPGLFPQGNPHLAKEAYVRSADLVLCISESTRTDMLAVYGNIAAPIVVTPLGVDQRFGAQVADELSLPKRYVLYVGGRGSYKDFPVFAEAFGRAFPGDSDVWLVSAGSSSFTDAEMDLLRRLGIADRSCHMSLTDRELGSAYGRAVCFAFPSRYEGFGLPTLEAMASGCPVALSLASCHPEVGGEAAEYFSPGDASGLAQILLRYAEDPALRAERSTQGLQRAAEFSWSRTAALTAAAYRQAAGVATSKQSADDVLVQR